MKTLYVVPNFTAEGTVKLQDHLPRSSSTSIVVETALPRRCKHKRSASLFSASGCSSTNILAESISLVANSPAIIGDDIELEDGNIFMSADAIKHEIDEDFFEISMSEEDDYDSSQGPKKTSTLPFLLPKRPHNFVPLPNETQQNKVSETRNKHHFKSKLEQALSDIYEKNFSPLRAAHLNGVKLDTLESHLNGQSQRAKGILGADPPLSMDEELSLDEWIRTRYKSGFPVKKIDLINKVANMVIGRPTRFKEGIPGEKWFLNFLIRHPTVSTMGPSVRADSRQVPSKRSINTWFKTCYEYLVACGHTRLLDNPACIGTAEEIVLRLNPADSESDDDSTGSSGRDEDSGNISVIIGACADGQIMPPMPVFSCRKPSPNLVDSVPYGWGIGLSKEGAVDKSLLLNYFKNILIPWMIEHDKIPFILFIDKLKLYLSVDTADFCARKGLIIYNFYPNSNYVLEPLYKYIIDGIQTSYNATKHYHSDKRALLDFCPNLEKAIRAIATPTSVRDSFRLCGIFPFDHNAADYKKCLLGLAQREAKSFTLSEYSKTFEVLETLIGREKLAAFCNAASDSSARMDIEDAALFRLWNKMAAKSDSTRKPNADAQEYRHEKMLRDGTRKLPRPDTYLKVTADEDDPLQFANLTGNALSGIDAHAYLDSVHHVTEVLDESDDDSESKGDTDSTSKCISAKLWKQYYQATQVGGAKSKKRTKAFPDICPYSKKVKLFKELRRPTTSEDVCCQCRKAHDKLITCRFCRKSVHFECMVDNERQLLDDLNNGVVDFDYVCLSCS